MFLEEPEDGTFNRRWGVRLDDGARVEAVLYRGDTLCLSTQVGCAVACPFCASGAQGLGRQLLLEELQHQVMAVVDAGHEPKKLTLSGVGEPLHNEGATLPFLHWAREQGYRVSLTTSGGPLKKLRTWLALPHNGLTISVHSGTEETRAKMVPKGPALGPLFETLEEVLPTLTRKRRKKTALAYLMLHGANDGDAELDAFAERVLPLGVAVHLYDHNPVPTSEMHGVGRERYEAAYARLREKGLVVRMSSQARLEANGGCGTLVALKGKRPASSR